MTAENGQPSTITPDEIAQRLSAVEDAKSLAELLQQVHETHQARIEQLPKWMRVMRNRVSEGVVKLCLAYDTGDPLDQRYRIFRIPKKTRGQYREIKAPTVVLKKIQTLLLECLSVVFTPSESAHGFTAGRSVRTNAQPHVSRDYVYNVDLRDFFPNTHFGRVMAVLQLPPFNLTKRGAWLVTNLCTDRTEPSGEGTPGRASLPQGAPTSPLLTNAVCQRLDWKLRRLARQHRARYTRYADDITFSANRPAFTEAFRQQMHRILKEEGYESNSAKERLQRPWQRQEVTGVVVNERTTAPREFVREIRTLLHYWEKMGLDQTQALLERHYGYGKGHARYRRTQEEAEEGKPAGNVGHTPSLRRVLAGKIAYLGMLRGPEDPVFLRMRDQLHDLDGTTLRAIEEEMTLLALQSAAAGPADSAEATDIGSDSATPAPF